MKIDQKTAVAQFIWTSNLEMCFQSSCLKSIFGKISAQPHTTLCIQFLARENSDKNNTFPLGKQIYLQLCGNFTANRNTKPRGSKQVLLE